FAASVSAVISACLRASCRWETAIASSASSCSCCAACRARASAMLASLRTREHLRGEGVDALLLVEEPLGGRADGVLGAADLDDGHALEVALDALLAH